MANKKSFDRTRRVADTLQQALARIILQDLGDKRFQMVTVTGVTVSRDLSYAKVYVSVLADDEDQIKDTIRALNRVVKLIRYNLAKEVKMRVTPELKFVFDDSISRGFMINNLIEATNRDLEQDDDADKEDQAGE